LAISFVPALTPFYNTEKSFYDSVNVRDTRVLGYNYPEFNGLDLGNKEAVRVAIEKKLDLLYPDPTGTDGEFYDWTVQVQSKQFELHASYSITLFLGEVPIDTNGWPTSKNFAGTHTAFVNNAPQDCKNCEKHKDLITEGYVHLNQAIEKHRKGSRPFFKPNVIKDYLTKNLQWRVLRVKKLSTIV